jgi:hemerythrin
MSNVQFSWEDRYLLGYAPMDHIHEEFVALVDAVLKAEDAAMAEAMKQLRAHLEAHFQQEDRWMNETDFPPRSCHIDEPTRVLDSVMQVQQLLETERDYALCRKLALALKDWFPGHSDYLDSALAAWMVKRAHAGKPLVFRRKVKKTQAVSS